jgi:ribosomal protein S18 acetylase RimI-like enzyme
MYVVKTGVIMKKYFLSFIVSLFFSQQSFSMSMDIVDSQDDDQSIAITIKSFEINAETFHVHQDLFETLKLINTAAFSPLEFQSPITRWYSKINHKSIFKLLNERWEKSTQRILQKLQSSNSERCLLITATMQGNKPVGFVLLFVRSLKQHLQELLNEKRCALHLLPNVTEYEEGEEAYIETTAIAPSFRGMNIGSNLIQVIHRYLPRVKHLYLETETRNEVAMSFYEKLGFIQKASFSAEWEECVIYSKVLSQ